MTTVAALRQRGPADLEEARVALSYIPADDRELWVRLGMALRAEFGDDGFALWDAWSQTDEEGYNSSDARAVWRSMKGTGIGIGTLYHEAKERGFRPSGKSRPGHTPEQETEFNAKRARKREEDERKAQERAERAKRMASELWGQAQPATEHAYLTRKGIKAHGTRVGRYTFHVLNEKGEWEPRTVDNCLLIPLRDANGALANVQVILPERDPELGDKRFLPGGRVSGLWYQIGEPAGVVCVCEGFATGVSIHEATGYALRIAFNAGNLEHVARKLREKYPEAQIIVCGDNDQRTTGNPGATKAREAARAVGGLLALPVFKNATGETDFNDLACLEGKERVKEIIDAAGEPDKTEEHSPRAVPAQVHTPPKLAEKPDILAELTRALRAQGVVGEERNAKVIYLAMTSRLLDEPVSVAIKGVSSSGKSFTIESTAKFFPPSAYMQMTAMSERALVYSKEDFKHRTILLFEAVALREQREKNESNLTAYFIRSLLSEGKINYPVSVRDKEEGWVTKNIVKEGPTNLIITTTATSLHGENETRLISLPTNDTQSQTKAILRQLAAGKPEPMDYRDWHELQEWLKTAKRSVCIPYAKDLAKFIPPVAVRLRRDFRQILRLIETHVILHQVTRETDDRGRIIATEADYQAVRALVAGLVSEGVGATVPATIRETVECVRELARDDGVKVSAVAERLNLDRTAAQRRIQSARECGYIVNVEDKRGQPSRYVIGDPMPDEMDLLPLSLTAVQVCNDRKEGNGPEHDEGESNVLEPRAVAGQSAVRRWREVL